ncbi:MAG: VCBS repeat-containing protein [Planctomycetota bacterium]|nr:VCBS repeat-containing protein [Planctomycetota bacterium]
MTRTRNLLGLAAFAAFASPSFAQFNQQWVSYTNETATHLPGLATSISYNNTETDFAWGDLDNDGDDDLVVVRKEDFTSTGKRTNLLLMNEGGILVDRTTLYASAADVPGDQGFNTPTNDRDAVFADFNQDGWLDVVTATTLSDGNPKHIGHPRIYMNLGNDGSGNWLGLRFEDARFPQFLHFGSGSPQNPRFCSVAAGDVTGDGYPDIYFGDYDSSGAGGAQQGSNEDLNDRLVINDGNGFFTDQSQSRMSTSMLKSAFGNSVVINDFNGDGLNDVVKDTSLNAPQYVAVSYNNPSNVGFFNIFHDFHFNAPYHTSEGDLNNDGRLDLIISDDASDRMRINTGTDAFGRATWSSAQQFSFLTGGDDGFASNNLVADLDGDGWNDALIADVDVDIGGYSRRLHIYHNRTTTPGDMTPTLREERQSSSSSGWIGVVGMKTADLKGTHDVAVFDLDGDGDNDMVVSQQFDTKVWINGSVSTPCGFTKYGVGASAANYMDLTGTGSGSVGTTASLTTTGAPGSSVFQVISVSKASLSLFGGVVLIDFTNQLLPMGIGSASAGTNVWNLPIPASSGLVGFEVNCQTAAIDSGQPGGFAMSNGVELILCP